MNDRIRITPIRVVNAEGEMLGVMDTEQALQLARDGGLDLVEVSPEASPPVCRIMDFGKAQYEKQKKARNSKPAGGQLKQIRLRPKIGEHDIQFKVDGARKFLELRDKVKVNVQFRGRENAHQERGRQLLEDIIQRLADVAVVEQPIRMDTGRSMSVVLTPNAKIAAGGPAEAKAAEPKAAEAKS